MRYRRAFQAKAQGMVEFALILPLLLLVMFAIIEFGRLIFIYSAVFTSSRDAARYGAAAGDIGGYVAHYQDCDGMRDNARRIGNLVGILNSDIDIEYDEGPSTASIGTCPVGGTGPADVGLGDRVIVTVTATYRPMLPLVNLLTTDPDGQFDISSTTARTILKDINIAGTPSAPTASMRVFFSTASSSVVENDVVVDVRVSINAPYAENVLVDVLVDGSSTATQGFAGDYTYTPGQVMIIAGHTFVDVPVTIHQDTMYEGDETVVLTLANPVNAALGAITTHILTISDDDPPPTVYFTSDAQTMDEAGGSTFITAALSNVSGIAATVPISVISGTASLGSDFTFNPVGLASVTIPAGQLSADINLTVINDLLDEDDTEVAVIAMGPPTNAVLGSPTQHALSITDDDLPPTVYFTLPAEQGMEGALVHIPVTLSAPSGRTVTVPYTYSSADATEGSDYLIPGANPLVIPAGSLTADILVELFRDSPTEDPPDALNESVMLTLSPDPVPPPDNTYTLGVPFQNILTIIPNEPPTVYFSSASQTAAESATSVTVNVLLNAAYDEDVSVPILLSGLATSPADYSVTSPLPVVIPAGSASASLTINLVDDTMDELDETIILTMGTPPNAVLGTPSVHTVTIQDDDPAPSVYFTTNGQSGGEDVGTMLVTARLSAVSGKDILMSFGVGGTATQGSDYSLSPGGSLTIPASTTQADIRINVVNDDASGGANLYEPSETVILTINPSPDYSIGTYGAHTATISAWTCPTAVSFAYDSGNNRLLVWNFAYSGTATLRLTQVTINWPAGTAPLTEMRSITFGGPIWSGTNASGSLTVNPTWSGVFANQQMIFQLNRHPNGGTTSVSATFEHCLPYSRSISN